MYSDDLTRKEFNAYCREMTRRTPATISTVDGLPFYGAPDYLKRHDMKGLFEIRGIEEEYFKNLNGTRVFAYAKPRLPRRVRNSIEQVKKNEDGQEVWEWTPKPTDEDTLPVLSTINIQLPYKYEPRNGFGYADRWTTGEYGYYIPTKYLYPVNLTVLAISDKRNLQSFTGMSVQSYMFGRLYICIAPYRDNLNPYGEVAWKKARVLGVKEGDNWGRECVGLFDYLEGTGILPPLEPLVGVEFNPPLRESFSDMLKPYVEVSKLSVYDSKTLKSTDMDGQETAVTIVR